MSALFIGKYRASENDEFINDLFGKASSLENRENIRKMIIDEMESQSQRNQESDSAFKNENRMIGDTQDLRELSVIG